MNHDQIVCMLLFLIIGLLLVLITLHDREGYAAESEINPGYAFKKILSMRPRSVFECVKLARKVIPKGYDIFPYVVACQQNNKRLVMAKNLL